MNPISFEPFGGLPDGVFPQKGNVKPPDEPGIGFETKTMLYRRFQELHD